jgi:hypothetical protein
LWEMRRDGGFRIRHELRRAQSGRTS